MTIRQGGNLAHRVESERCGEEDGKSGSAEHRQRSPNVGEGRAQVITIHNITSHHTQSDEVARLAPVPAASLVQGTYVDEGRVDGALRSSRGEAISQKL